VHTRTIHTDTHNSMSGLAESAATQQVQLALLAGNILQSLLLAWCPACHANWHTASTVLYAAARAAVHVSEAL
jgi:hypothetical protein